MRPEDSHADRGTQQPTWDAEASRRLWLDVLTVSPVTLIISITFGAAAVGAGFSPTVTIILSLVMFSGAAQFATVGIIASGGSAFAAWTAAMLISARFGILAISVATRLRLRGIERLLASVLVVDPNALIMLSRSDEETARRAFWRMGWFLYVVFAAGTTVGALSGTLIAERFDVIAIDVALPSFLTALVVQSARGAETRVAPLLGIAVAAALFLVVGPELAILLAPLGVLVLLVPAVRDRLPGGHA